MNESSRGSTSLTAFNVVTVSDLAIQIGVQWDHVVICSFLMMHNVERVSVCFFAIVACLFPLTVHITAPPKQTLGLTFRKLAHEAALGEGSSPERRCWWERGREKTAKTRGCLKSAGHLGVPFISGVPFRYHHNPAGEILLASFYK